MWYNSHICALLWLGMVEVNKEETVTRKMMERMCDTGRRIANVMKTGEVATQK